MLCLCRAFFCFILIYASYPFIYCFTVVVNIIILLIVSLVFIAGLSGNFVQNQDIL